MGSMVPVGLGVVLFRHGGHERRRLEVRLFLGFVHAFNERFLVDVKEAAEVQRVERMQRVAFHGLFGDDHEVVDGFVEDKELAVAVVNLASGGILRHETQSVVVGQLLVVLVDHLQGKQPDEEYHTHGDEHAHHQ